MTDAMRVQCQGDELTEYAAGRLPVDRQWAWDRHLVACQACAHDVAQERRLRSALAGAPSMPGDLRSSLLALGAALATDLGPRPVPTGHDQLALLHPSAPPCHRSALRATVVAAAAAGLSAAAAWSLTVAPAPVGARPGLATATTPVVSPAVAPTRAAPAPVSISQVRLIQTVVVGRSGERAESTP
jgi:anti-sigma factor RsiW